MKKVLMLVAILFSVLLFSGCVEGPANPTVKGIKTIAENATEEMIYEWDVNEPTKLIKRTIVFTYTSNTNAMYNEKAIECTTFKKQGSLFDCKVERKDGKVYYKQFYYADLAITEEEAKEQIVKDGYTLE